MISLLLLFGNLIHGLQDQRTPLHLAVSNNSPAVIDELIRSGADINAIDEVNTLFLCQSLNYHDIHNDYYPELSNCYFYDQLANDMKAVHTCVFACLDMNLSSVFILHLLRLRNLILVLQTGMTILHYAANNNDPAVIDLLVGFGANVNARDNVSTFLC